MLVRTFGPDDIAFAAQLSQVEGRGISAPDYQDLIKLEPTGCFVAEEAGQPVGLVTTVSYGKFGWIGGLIVKSEHRRRGYGRALLDRAVGCLLDHGVRTVAVDATMAAMPFYKRAGFKPAFETLHLKREAAPAPNLCPDSLVPLEDKDIHAVMMFDWALFGGPRLQVLHDTLSQSPVAYLVQDQEGVGGYLMARHSTEGWVIGPWVCIRSAEPLLTQALETIGQETVQIVTPKINQQALHILRSHGFRVYYHEMRMYHGDPEGLGRPEHIYAICSTEKG